MRFIADIAFRGTRICSASIGSRDGETPEDAGTRARGELVRDANRSRSSALTDAVLDRIADAFAGHVARHAASGESGQQTCAVLRESEDAEAVRTFPGGFVLHPSVGGDLVAHLRSLSDAAVAEMDELVASLLEP